MSVLHAGSSSLHASYLDELARLRDAGGALAVQHPGSAGMLGARSDDPDIERLLQGFAFVAAGLRRRIDDAAPELVESLTELLMPSVLRPTPAATIVAFRPATLGMRAPQHVPAGTLLAAREIAGTRCTFRTTRALDVLPLRLTSTRLEGATTREPELTLRLEAADGGTSLLRAARPLRLHLHGAWALTSQLGLWLARHVRSVHVRDDAGHEATLGGADVVRMLGRDPSDALLPTPAFVPQGSRLLHEYFSLPAKFAFVDLLHLERAASLAGTSLSVVVRFDRPPPIQGRLPDDVLRLHCVPAVNLFDVDAEPLRADLDERPTMLRAAGVDPAHMEIFEVRSVQGVRRNGERVPYGLLHALPSPARASRTPGFYALKRRPSPIDDGVDTLLTLHRDLAAARACGPETLAVELTCTNRGLASALAIGDLATPTTSTPAGVAFTNIVPVTPPVRSPLGEAVLWDFVASLACTRRSLADREVLAHLLGVQARRGAAPERDLSRIDAITRVEVESVTRPLAGTAVRGSLYRIDLDPAGFASEGDAFSFGDVLHELLACDARLNSFADLSVHLSGTDLTFCYDAQLVP